MRDRRYWLRLLRLFVVAMVGTAVILPMGLGGLMMWGLTHPTCNRTAPDTTLESVTFTTPQGYTLGGYFMPGTNGATVIVVPAMSNDRGGSFGDARIFHNAGFNVLTFDARVCTGAGFHSLGWIEAEDAEAAFHYLTTRDDVDAARISIHGFSSAGATSLFTAARVPTLRAVSAEGGYHDFAEQLGVGLTGSLIERLISGGAGVMYRLVTGLDVRVLSPVSVVDAIAPRPILLIYGSREVSLPGARQMLERANANGGNAALWVVEGAGHGDYSAVAGDEYAARLVAFHGAALQAGE